MEMILWILGGICLFYYGILLSVGMDFSIVWLLAGVFLAGGGCWLKFVKWDLPSGIKIVFGVVVTAGILFFLIVQGLIFRGMFAKGEPKLTYLVVLGAQVRGTEPSRALRKRLDTASDYLKENPDTIVVVSGGQGTGEDITEAEAMEKYLLDKGIEKERIIKEDRSTSTAENLEFTAELISKDAPVGLVTNNFHVYRAVKMAEKQGYTEVCGIAAPSDPLYQAHYLVREFFALIKAWSYQNI